MADMIMTYNLKVIDYIIIILINLKQIKTLRIDNSNKRNQIVKLTNKSKLIIKIFKSSLNYTIF
jgi:hypothetical protein